MDILVISNNERILHISNEENNIDFTIYDNKCNLLDGGIINLENDINNDDAVKNVVSTIENQFDFSQPFIYLSNELTEELLELIQETDYQKTQEKVQSILSNHNTKDEIELEMVD